jgi:tetratricopeptide (TPR) repeat protein
MKATRTLLVLALCLALPAAAQNAEVKKFVNSAISLYENLEYEKALKQLTKARVKATTPDDEVKVTLLEAIVLADMGREEKALTAFKTAFGIDLDAKLPVDVGPKVQAVADKARASVRKLMAPALEAQKAEEQRKAAEEKARADEVARLAAEEKRKADEDKVRNAPPPAVVAPPPAPDAKGPSVRSLSWIPGVVGLASAGVGTYFLVSASGKYNALLNGSVDLATANGYRTSGPTDALVGDLLIGVGVAGVLGAVAMFVFGAPAPSVALVPTREGAVLSFGGTFDLIPAR